MLALFRLILIALFVVIFGVFGTIFCLFRPFNPKNVHFFAQTFSKMAKVLGVNLLIRRAPGAETSSPCLIIANHQNSYDIFTISGALPPRGVTIGKKSLKWIPFFGWLYWLSGNILINRNDRRAAQKTLQQTADIITQQNVSVWMFPEGTRSYGKGLLKFKRGAFELANVANVPVMPICMSTTTGKIKLNRWNNGTVIIDIMAPRELTAEQKKNSRVAADEYHALLKDKLEQLDAEVDQINQGITA
ncbi:1-acyl-sn-glycerol-3-phosphate acyltransferase [Saccharobesus litoralis]|uniref:1-acyl-sn-glycerol-3-phosphate acyltransferase n=1 Tax=Saccharobesus litoralis TaxID=2172099 RepID=A0A2S0VMI8_9ALTE|nr:1-acyl-sn-glycerol-3-phosphate acyltransferase [Saccharobesus litoralis]